MNSNQISQLLNGQEFGGKRLDRQDRARITGARDRVWHTMFSMFDGQYGGELAGTLAQMAADVVARRLIDEIESEGVQS